MAKDKLFGVQWIARSYLADVELMDKDVEATYFRILNYIYQTQDRLVDDDNKLWKLTKCSSIKQYRQHKKELMQSRGTDPETGEEIPARLNIRCQNGPIPTGTSTPIPTPYLTSDKCSKQMGTASRMRHAKSEAGKASARARKLLRNNKPRSTAVGTEGPTEVSTHYIQDAQQNGQRDGASVLHNLKRFPTETYPYTPHSEFASGSGSLVAPPDRPSATPKPASTEEHGAEDIHGRVCVHYPKPVTTGKPDRLLWIDTAGGVDEVSLVRDLPSISFTRDEALELRAAAVAWGDAKPPDQP